MYLAKPKPQSDLLPCSLFPVGLVTVVELARKELVHDKKGTGRDASTGNKSSCGLVVGKQTGNKYLVSDRPYGILRKAPLKFVSRPLLNEALPATQY
jgi:hypothetical protein